MKRTRIKPMSSARAAELEHRAAVRIEVFNRDGRCRLAGSLLGPCIGPLTPHHLWKEGQGGPYIMGNLLSLCEGHNGGVETMPRADAEALGLVLARRVALAVMWRRLVAAGIVDYWHDGTPASQPQPDLDIVRLL